MATKVSRLVYASNDVLVSDAPGARDQEGTYSLKRLDVVQSTSITIENSLSRKKQIGYGDFLYNTNLMPPNVSAEVSYLSRDNSNELILGLNASGIGIYSGLDQTGKDRNLFFIFDTGADLRNVSELTNYNNQIQVMGVGNSFVTNYSCQASIGSIPSATVSFVGSNINFQNYQYPLNPSTRKIPSLESGKLTNYKYLIASDNFDKSNYISNYSQSSDFIRPGDIVLELEDSTTGIGGVKFVSSGNIQNYQIEVPFERQDLNGFGSDYPYERKLQYPNLGSVAMSVIFDGFNVGIQTGVNFQNRDYNFSIKLKDCTTRSDKLVYRISGAKLASQEINTQIGDSFIFNGSFTFPVTETGGFSIDGVCRFS